MCGFRVSGVMGYPCEERVARMINAMRMIFDTDKEEPVMVDDEKDEPREEMWNVVRVWATVSG